MIHTSHHNILKLIYTKSIRSIIILLDDFGKQYLYLLERLFCVLIWQNNLIINSQLLAYKCLIMICLYIYKFVIVSVCRFYFHQQFNRSHHCAVNLQHVLLENICLSSLRLQLSRVSYVTLMGELDYKYKLTRLSGTTNSTISWSGYSEITTQKLEFSS